MKNPGLFDEQIRDFFYPKFNSRLNYSTWLIVNVHAYLQGGVF
jgi:hypothetical protein